MTDTLAALRRASRTRARTEAEWRQSIKDAATAGHSIRAIGRAADVTHTRILQIIRDAPTNPDPAHTRAHRQVAKARGTAKECSHCGTTDPDKIYEWANLTGNYDDIADYERLCRSCHRKYDKTRVQQLLRD